MVEFINEPVSVEVRVRADGTVLPLSFAWRSRRYLVESWGRESFETVDDHTRHSYLVQAAGQQTWELCLEVETGCWCLVRRWVARHRPV